MILEINPSGSCDPKAQKRYTSRKYLLLQSGIDGIHGSVMPQTMSWNYLLLERLSPQSPMYMKSAAKRTFLDVDVWFWIADACMDPDPIFSYSRTAATPLIVSA